MLKIFHCTRPGASQLKRMPFYAVRVGRKTGIYATWQECKEQVDGVTARFKKFKTREDAESFMNVHNPNDHKRKVFVAKELGGGTQGSTSEKTKPHPKSLKRKFENKDDENKRQKTDSFRPVVYTDGCCTRNGKSNAKAGIGVFWGDGDNRNISEPLLGHPTNQRAELNAAIKALEITQAMSLKEIEIRTDSMYTLNAVTKWMKAWQNNGFCTSTGSDVKNKEDIMKLYNLCQEIDVKWTHVRGHSNDHGNDKADELAKLGSVK